MAEIPEPECGASYMLESTVDRLGWPVARAGPVEVREHVGSSTFESPAKSGQLRQRCWHSHGEARDHCLHAGPSTHSIGVAVSARDALVHPPRHIDLSVLLLSCTGCSDFGCRASITPGDRGVGLECW